MTADWKKKPLDRAKPREDLKALQAEVRDLKQRLAQAKGEAKYYAQKCEQIVGNWNACGEAAARYDALRMKGVLIDHGGEFKFLQGKDLDAFWDRPKEALTEASLARAMQNSMAKSWAQVLESGVATYWIHDEQVVVYPGRT